MNYLKLTIMIMFALPEVNFSVGYQERESTDSDFMELVLANLEDGVVRDVVVQPLSLFRKPDGVLIACAVGEDMTHDGVLGQTGVFKVISGLSSVIL